MTEKRLIGLSYKELADFISDICKMKSVLKDESDKPLKYSISDIEKQFDKIDKMFVNKLAVSRTILHYVRHFTDSNIDSNGKIKNVGKHISDMSKYLEQELNKHILSAKRADSKLNRVTEKSTVIRFMRSNSTQFKNLFDLANMIIDLKLDMEKRNGL